MKKKLLGILGAFVAFFASTSGIYNSVDPKNESNYLTFTNNSSSDVYVQINKTNDPTEVKLIYSTDNASTWNTFKTDSTKYVVPKKGNIKIIAGEVGQPIGSVINNSFTIFDSSTVLSPWRMYQFKWFDSSGSTELTDPVISASGDITSLLNGTGGDYNLSETEGGKNYCGCFSQLFWENKCLISTPNFPSTTLSNSCYFYMFYGCTSLTVAPSLPATTLTKGCYANMFSKCTSIKKIPDLSHVTYIDPGDDVHSNSVKYMFEYCSSIIMYKTSTTLIGNWAVGASSLAGKVTAPFMFYECSGVSSGNTPIVATKYCLSYTTTFAATNSLGGYYKNGSTKQAMVAFSATVAKEDIALVTSFGFEEVDGTTIIESNDTQLAEFKTNNNGNFYTVIDCDDEGITKNYKAFIKIGSTTTKSDTLTATSNYTIEYTL